MTERNTMLISAQLEGVQALLARVNTSLERACEQRHAEAIAKLRADQHLLEAVCVTLGWLAKDREGCIQLLSVSRPKK